MPEAFPDGNHLVLDACGPQTAVAVFRDRICTALEISRDPALESLFRLSRLCLSRCGLKIGDLQGFIASEGPGSTLGLRLAAMALHTWQSLKTLPVLTYNSLVMTARVHSDQFPGESFAAPWKSGAWFLLKSASQAVVPLQGNPLPDTTRLVEVGRLPRKLPDAPVIPYPIREILESLPSAADCLQPTKSFVPFSPEPSVFRKWTPQTHRAG